MIDQRGHVAHQHIVRIAVGIMRRGTVAMHAEIEHQHFEPLRGDRLVMPPFDPVHLRAGKQPVQEDERAPCPMPMQREARAVETVEEFGGHRFASP